MRRFFCWLLGCRVNRAEWEAPREYDPIQKCYPLKETLCHYCRKVIDSYPVRFL